MGNHKSNLMLLENIFTLFMLILLQAVLGFDNLLYISLESKRAPKEKQKYVRKLGIGLAVFLRIIMLFVVVKLVAFFQEPWIEVSTKFFSGAFTFESLITLFGGVFIIYTAIKEIWHMMELEEHDEQSDKSKGSVGKIIFLIVMMNLVFSFDSILSAMALANHTDANGVVVYNMTLMTIAILVSGAMMIWLADKVSEFLQKNRMYEVLGLFILLIVGVMLLTEGGHKAEMTLFENHITAMNKTTFYFVILVLVLVDIVQSRYQRKLNK